MNRTGMLIMVVLAAAGFSATALGCDFYFNYERVEAPLGAVGEIGIQVQKTHNNCTLPSMESYEIGGDGVQVLERTEWVEVGRNLYETWVRVSLSTMGDGRLTISKDCTKKGEESGHLPVSVLAPAGDGVWATALSGIYPFEAENVRTVAGLAVIEGDVLAVDGISVRLPEPLVEIDGADVRLFFVQGDTVTPLLVISEAVFWRFDHLSMDAG